MSLQGKKVLITRPEQQAKTVCELVEKAGGQAITFPVIDIVPIPPEKWSQHALSEQNMIIFISRNAVMHFVSELTQPLPEKTLLAAVGAGTADSMREKGLRVDIQPPQSTGSEGLLAMPELQLLDDQNVLIVRGKGGRELLAESLHARGANIRYIEVYERSLPSPSAAEYQLALTANYVVCTSVAGVENLLRLLQDDVKALLTKPLVVMSERIKQYALTQGFHCVEVADESSDSAVIQRLIEMENSYGK
ncbi:MAG: uroporphyrinogen-III synthase [Gammaproteobacteria bacterium]|nr:uroporphyrinogen-III synthase [Gammaproteobacteria bacterium]